MKFIAQNLSVDRGERRIVEEVSFALEAGEILVITGSNGIGKTTLLRAVSGLLPITQGRLQLKQGSQIQSDPMRIRENIAYLGPSNAMKPSLSVRENLEFWRDFSTSPASSPAPSFVVNNLTIDTALETLDLTAAADLPFGYLSTGMKRRVAISRMLLGPRPIWIADEPTSGLDAKSAKLFSDLLGEHSGRGGVSIIATHLPLGIKKAQSLRLNRPADKLDSDAFEPIAAEAR